MALDAEILAQVRRIQLRTNRQVNDVMVGGYTSVFRGSGIEFDEVREFVEGDDPRMVDWNVTARTGRPYIKKYMEERELTVVFLVDASASMGFGTVQKERGGVRTVRETAAEFCACLSLAASRNNDKTGLVVYSHKPDLYVPAKKGRQHTLRLIREILAFEAPDEAGDLVGAVEYLRRVQRKRAIVFVLSDFLVPMDPLLKPLRSLSKRHDVVAVRILDPHTLELPNAGLLHVRDLETGAATLVDSSSRRVREAYAERMQQKDQQLRELMARCRVDLMTTRTSDNVIEPIVRFFRMRELRGLHQ